MPRMPKRKLTLPPINRRGMRAPSTPEDEVAPWYKIVEAKKKDEVTKIYLYDAIGGWFGIYVNDFIKELNDVETKEIHLHINSPGGSVYDGIAIYNSLKQHDSNVTVYIDSLAASAASFIAMAGDKIIAARNSTMMIHDASGVCMGNMQDMLDTAEALDQVSDNIADMYAYNAGGTQEEWRELMKAETWYSAKEALDAGLVDEMLDPDPEPDEDEPEHEDNWDLSNLFNYAGRVNAPNPVQVRNQIQNKIQEASMGTAPKNNETKPGQSEPSKETEGAPAVETEPAKEPAPAGDPSEQQPDNQANMVMVNINGTQQRVPKAVADHMGGLETFKNETIRDSRINFVESLGKNNLVAATALGDKPESDKQASGLFAFALSLSDQQFSDWKSTWDNAQPQTMFGNYGNDQGNAQAPGDNVQDRIEILQEIVDNHKRTGMSKERLEATDSYKELQQLRTNNA